MLPLILFASIGATPWPKTLWEKLHQKHPRLAFLMPIGCLAILILCTAYLVDSTFSPFLYYIF
ncbi:MAG: MBOAT family protein, partial [Clostridia bacterium]|nr:MBOAT family protein [Clostridia bacterium]